MTALVLGLLVFLGVHSTRVFAESWRARTRHGLGEGVYKGLYSLLSLVGFALIIWGYGQARLHPVPLWSPLPGARHLASLLMLLSFVLLAAAYVPGNGIKARLHHPMVADLLLFGGFLVWAVLSFRAARQRDREAGMAYGPGRAAMTAITVVAGLAGWAVFAFWAHSALIGVRPFG
jgi:uncharacterized membrane protein